MHETIPGYNGIVQHQPDDDIRIIGSVTLTCFLLLTIAGMDWVTRVQKFLLVILIFAQLDMFLGQSERVPELVLSNMTLFSRQCSGPPVRHLVRGENSGGKHSETFPGSETRLRVHWVESGDN